MQRPNLISNPYRYNIPSTQTLTNTNIDDVDFATSSVTMYGNTINGTIPVNANEGNFRCVANDLDLALGMSFCVGFFLAASAEKGNCFYQCNGSVSWVGDSATNVTNLSVIPVFGRAISGTITGGFTAPNNQLQAVCRLPSVNGSSGCYGDVSCKEEVFRIYDSSSTVPYFFGFMFTNGSDAAAAVIKRLFVSISFVACVDDIDCFNPVRQ